jgi:hypothetical protein
MTLLSYVPKPNKSVILISTEHHSNAIGEAESNAVKKKPEMLFDYNNNKGF